MKEGYKDELKYLIQCERREHNVSFKCEKLYSKL